MRMFSSTLCKIPFGYLFVYLGSKVPKLGWLATEVKLFDFLRRKNVVLQVAKSIGKNHVGGNLVDPCL